MKDTEKSFVHTQEDRAEFIKSKGPQVQGPCVHTHAATGAGAAQEAAFGPVERATEGTSENVRRGTAQTSREVRVAHRKASGAGREKSAAPRTAHLDAAHKAQSRRSSLPRTILTRTLACLAAVAILAGLGFWVNRQAGNPLSAKYTEKKIAAHYRAYHPGEGYVVGPAVFQGVSADNVTWKERYVCSVYRKGSPDTGFIAYYEDGAVWETEAITVATGTNTYNRFRNAINAELAGAGIKDAIGAAELFADFYAPDAALAVFDPAAPVFQPDSPYDRAALPLPTVVCATKEAGEATDEALCGALLELKNVCEERGLHYDYYSMQLMVQNGDNVGGMYVAFDVPADALATQEDAAHYVQGLSEEQKRTGILFNYAETLLARKSTVLSNGTFSPCMHETGPQT